MNFKDTVKELLPVILITIFGTYLFSYVAFVVTENVYPNSFFELWYRWDTRHYLNIAEHGYASSDEGRKSILILFLPFYPYLTRVFALVFQDYLLSAFIVSNLAYAAAAYYLYKLVNLDFEKEDAYRSVIYLTIFPTAYFLHAAYSESLFLALTISSFYYARKENWALSGTIGMLAAATRITGIILLPVLLIEYLSQRGYRREKIRKDVLWIGLIGLGLGLYLILNYDVAGDPFYFLEVKKESWSGKLALPYQGFLNALEGLPGSAASDVFTGDLAEIVFALLGLIGTVYCFFRLRLSYSLYALATWIIATSTWHWLNIPRFTLTMFPLLIVLALVGRRRGLNFAIIFLSLMCFALFLTQFVRFRWAF
jgi:4-amino-4-deoxy-L-arabinose transferase-like glycosyltransferase